MVGSAHFVILWHENTCFCGKTGHRMTYTASIVILWHKNESGGGGVFKSRPWWDWKNCFFGRGGTAELAKQSKRNQRSFLPAALRGALGKALLASPRKTSWTEAHPVAVAKRISPARKASSWRGSLFPARIS